MTFAIGGMSRTGSAIMMSDPNHPHGAPRAEESDANHGARDSHALRHHTHAGHYFRLAVMVALMFVAMYWLMYAMVDRWANVYNSVNQFYMAGLMTAAMLPIELVVMGSMYARRKVNLGIVVVSLLVFITCWIGIRKQTAVGDRQFLRSMIPHHAGAVLMSEQSSITDPDIQRLAQSIIQSQQAEIAEMKTKLKQLDAR